MSWLYLLAIVVSMACMGLVDHRWSLFLFDRPGRAFSVVAIGAGCFLLWDVLAIGLDVYERGRSAAMTGIELADDLPLEELFFVVFLCYVTMVLHHLCRLLLGTRSRVGDAVAERVAR